MSRIKSYFKTNKGYKIAYISIVLLFMVWILFLDSHSWLTHRELNKEIELLEKRKAEFIKAIDKDEKAIEILENIDSLEKFARENFGHKREKETLFIVE